jgi:hypothetical protein
MEAHIASFSGRIRLLNLCLVEAFHTCGRRPVDRELDALRKNARETSDGFWEVIPAAPESGGRTDYKR